jgi:hypothetical protein
MKAMYRFGVGACALAGLVLAVGTDVQAACSRVSAQGEALTKEIATEMAKVNLEFAIAAKGAKAAGKATTTCGAPGPLLWTSCTAKQRACS